MSLPWLRGWRALSATAVARMPCWSVRTVLLWLVVACLVPGVGGALILFAHQYREGRAQLDNHTLQTTRALVQAVDNHLLRAQAVALTLATADSLTRRDFAGFHRQAREAMAAAGLGTNVVLRDVAGRQLVNTAVDFGRPLLAAPAPEQVREVFATARPVISDVFIGPVFKRPIMSVDVPVVVDGRVAYALGVGILPEHFDALLKAQSLPPNYVAGVLDRRGIIVGRTHAPERYVGQQVPAKLLERLNKASEGTVDVTSLDGTPVHSYFSTSPTTRWRVVIGIPTRAFEQALARRLVVLAAGISLLFGIGLLLARWMGRGIAQSVTALTVPAAALGRGEPVAVPQVYVTEAAEVAGAIRRAADLLSERDAALQARARELAEAHRLARFGTWHWNVASGEVKVSDSIPDIYGREVPPFPEQRGTLLTVESWERVNQAAQEALRTGRGYDLEIQVVNGGGRLLWIHAKCEAMRDDSGAVVALRGTIQDITERKEAEARLRESEERFRLLADNIAQFAWMADGQGYIFWYNRRWFDYTGTDLEQMRGWGWTKVHHPAHVDRVVAKIRRCFETGEPWEDTFPLRKADGSYRWFLSRAIPDRDAAGRVWRWFGTNTDITGQRETEEELRVFKFFSDHANDEHLLLDTEGAIRYANRLACERLGYGEDELLRLNVANIDVQHDPATFHELFAQGRQGRAPHFETRHRRKDGSSFPVEVAVTVLEVKGEWMMFATSRDISERKLAEQRVLEAALHDPLTGLPNRALVFEYGSHLLAASRRNHSHGALLFIDLDRFKPINDIYGHEIGDRVLQEVARRMAACIRQEDVVGRIGGDEFVIILPHLEPGQHRAATVARHLIASVSQPYAIDSLELSLSPSIGISHFPQHADDIGALIHAADLAMYQAKQSGRANYQFYTAELEARADEARSLEGRLKNALKRGGLILHYQPVMDLKNGRLAGVEALLRLADDAPAVGPERFIPVAEAAGLIGELGEWVAAEACRQHKAWRAEGLEISIAINVSPLQFRQREFPERLGQIVAAHGADAKGLQIEVTESTVMESLDDAVAILDRIKSHGMKVALDDFGTGYSSLSSLSRLPLDKLKVDQSFVRMLERDPRSQAITKAVIALGRALNLEIVGEGIESEATLQYLRGEGCDQAQGFWFSRPLPAAEFAQWYRQWETVA